MSKKENNPKQEIEIRYFGNIEEKPVLSFIVGVHGNEKAPIKAIELLQNYLKDIKIMKTFRVIYANKNAIELNKRFVDKDLNNCFSDNSFTTYESQIANELKKILTETEYNFDLHTTDFPIPGPYGIISVYNETVKDILEGIGIKNAVFVDKDGLIKYAPNGIGFETGAEDKPETITNAFELMKKLLSYFGVISNISVQEKSELKIFLIYNIIMQNNIGILQENIEDFQLVNKGDKIGIDKTGNDIIASENFYPIWTKEKLFIRKAKRIFIVE